MMPFFNLVIFFSFCCRSCFSLFVNLGQNYTRKVVSMPFDFSKGIYSAVATLCEAEVLSSGFQMRREI